jgi:transcriptional antiterminator NusG
VSPDESAAVEVSEEAVLRQEGGEIAEAAAAESGGGEPLSPEEPSGREQAEDEPLEAIADQADQSAEVVAAEEVAEAPEIEAPGTDEAAAANEPVAESAVGPESGTEEEAAEAVEEEAAEEAAEPEAQPAVDEDPEASNGEAPPPTIGVPGMDWYIIHSYSGFENKVRESLRTRADAFGFGERIGEILIPTEDVVEMRNGKKVTSKRLLYPGYVLVQLKLDDELWHVVKNTPRVTGFVGGGQSPAPLSADEVNQILFRQSTSEERPRPKLSFEKNDRVKIIDGPFNNFTGAIEDVNTDRNTLKVMVTIFGRATPVELEYFQVEKEQV